MSKKQAIVIRGFYTDQQVIDNLRKIKKDVSECFDVYFQYDEAPKKVDVKAIPSGITLSPFNQENWSKYKQPNPFHKTFIPGNVEPCFIMFQEEFPEYEYYWFIEYDVQFSGHWMELMAVFEKNCKDLLATTLVKREEFPNWGLWKSLTLPEGVDVSENNHVRGFYPIVRFSKRAISLMKKCLANGWAGHFEALTATIMLHHNYSIEDLGGDGYFVDKDNVNAFYTNDRFSEDLGPGTFLFRPKMKDVGTLENKLWHPVKDESIAVWDTKKSRLSTIASKVFNKFSRI